MESYKAAKNEKNRALVVKNAVEAVSKGSQLLKDKGVNLPKYLKTVCCFHSLSFSTVTHLFRPSLDILKCLLRRTQLKSKGI